MLSRAVLSLHSISHNRTTKKMYYYLATRLFCKVYESTPAYRSMTVNPFPLIPVLFSSFMLFTIARAVSMLSSVIRFLLPVRSYSAWDCRTCGTTICAGTGVGECALLVLFSGMDDVDASDLLVLVVAKGR